MLMVRRPNRTCEARAIVARLLAQLGLRGDSTLRDAQRAIADRKPIPAPRAPGGGA